MQTPNQQEFFSLMEEYTIFLERMMQDENEKLAALSSRQLPRIEHSIATAQANAKQLENYETRRLNLQKDAGWEGLSFREVMEQAAQEKQGWLQQVFLRFERSVGEIRFRNDKSMAVARDNMLDIDPAAVLPGQVHTNPYSKLNKKEQDGKNGMLETKI